MDHPDHPEEGLNAWPAFVDLLAATTLLLLALLAVVLVWAGAGAEDGAGALELQKERLANVLRAVGAEGASGAFTVDDADLLFVRVTLPEDATFPRNHWQWDSLQAVGRSALRSIGEVLLDPGIDSIYREVRVVGHSDQLPYALDAPFSNWELSAARAAVVARYLVTTVGLNPCKVSAIGYGPYRPVESPPGEAGPNSAALELNRRIELEFVPTAYIRGESPSLSTETPCYYEGDGTRARLRGQERPGDQSP